MVLKGNLQQLAAAFVITNVKLIGPSEMVEMFVQDFKNNISEIFFHCKVAILSNVFKKKISII